MKLSIAALTAVAAMVQAAPAPAEIFERQSGCAAVNEACLNSSSISLLTPLGGLIDVVPGFSLAGTTAALSCCAGYTCTGGSASLPGSLNPIAGIIGYLPYRSCTNG